ncbi:glycosyl transferase [Rhodobacterales bacterium 52_120_T64]|nr:glycosyl transferase [Rhodobacterales bacterium 52_120_T64]
MAKKPTKTLRATRPKSGKAPAKPPRRKKPQKGILARMAGWFFRTVFRVIWWVGIRTAIIGTVGMAIWVGYYYTALPPMEAQLDGRAGGSVVLLDRDREIFAWRGEQFDGSLRTGNVSRHLKNAVVATEDKRFYSHFGLSPRGIASAIKINLREGRGPLSGHGGSTLTQQVAKLLCLGEDLPEAECRQQTILRKIKEIPYSFAMELKYEKDDILSIYLNRAYLGGGAQGFEAAAQRYFGKSARELNAAESAMLAGLLKAPSRYAPTNNLQRAQDRSSVVVGLMQAQGYLTRVEAELALARPATLSQAAQERAGGYFADWIMADAPSFLTSDTGEDVEILTTFDRGIQKAAEEALTYVFENSVRDGSEAQAAIVVMSADGAVRAMVGGRKIDGSGLFNRATQASRQPGSSFKPFVYGAALESGMHPFDMVLDAPLTIDIPGSGPWSPRNYTNEFYGDLQMVDAMANSLNTVAVRLSEQVGREKVRAIARDFGVMSELAEGPALALGASNVTLLEMTGAYAGILNGGRQSLPYGWLDLRIRRDDQILMSLERTEGFRVLNERASGYLVYMMSQVVETGSGARAALADRPVAGKTGTTQGARDAWFIGFTGDYVAGVWMGYDDNSKLTGVTGGGLPAEIWRETMERVHEGLPVRPLPLIDPTKESPRIVNEIDNLVNDVGNSLLGDLINSLFGKPRR